MPIAATTHSVAAVVRPRIEMPWRMIAPAPRKPIPDTICAAIRVGSKVTPSRLEKWKSRHAYAETSVNTADPTETSRCVRSPASRSRSSRSRPIAPPSAAATTRRRRTSQVPTSGTRRCLLGGDELFDPGRGELEQLVEAVERERLCLGGRLHLDQAPAPGHRHVHVDLRARVLLVGQVEEGDAVDDADRYRRQRLTQGLAEPEAFERDARRDVRSRDRRTARAAVGLEDVAVEPDGALAERLVVRDRANGATDQPLDLHRPTALTAPARLPRRPLAGRRRQQRVLGRDPAAPLTGQPAWNALVVRRRAQHAGLALRQQDGPVRLLEELGVERERPQLVGPTPVGARHPTLMSWNTGAPCVTRRSRGPRARPARRAGSAAAGSARRSRGTARDRRWSGTGIRPRGSGRSRSACARASRRPRALSPRPRTRASRRARTRAGRSGG